MRERCVKDEEEEEKSFAVFDCVKSDSADAKVSCPDQAERARAVAVVVGRDAAAKSDSGDAKDICFDHDVSEEAANRRRERRGARRFILLSGDEVRMVCVLRSRRKARYQIQSKIVCRSQKG